MDKLRRRYGSAGIILAHHHQCSCGNGAYGVALVHISNRGAAGAKSIHRCIQNHMSDLFYLQVKPLLPVRPRLQASVLDTLHGAGVEIVSPTFMNQRRLTEDVRFVPPRHPPAARGPETPPPEEIIFDKADQKASLEELRAEREKLLAEIGVLSEKCQST